MTDEFDISELTERGPRLTDEHRSYLADHAVDPDLAVALGVHSVLAPDDLPADLLETWGERPVPGLLFPWSIKDHTWHQVRPDTAIEGVPKYVSSTGSGGMIWEVYRPDYEAVGVLLVEGTKQALAVASLRPRWRVYAMAGKDGWMRDGRPSPHLAMIADGLPLIAIIDADLATNPDVWASARRMIDDLPVVTLCADFGITRTPGSGVTGVDDYLSDFRPDDRQRMLDTVLDAASKKLPKEPKGGLSSDDPALALIPMIGGKLDAGELALYLDSKRPYAVAEDLATLYAWSESREVYALQKNMNARIASEMGSDINRVDRATTIAALQGVAKLNGRIITDPTHLVPVSNGMLDPDTGELTPNSPDLLCTNRWPVSYDPEATCPTIMEYLDRRMPGQADAFLDTACRMLDRDRTAQDRALLLFGPSRSGKSTALSLLQALVGPDAYSAVSLHDFADDKHAAFELVDKALNVTGEFQHGEVSDTAVFKALTGGDPVRARGMYREGFTFIFHGLMAFAMNDVPSLAGSSQAVTARIVPIWCPESFKGAEDEGVKLRLHEELPGLLTELVRRHQAQSMPEPNHVVAEYVRDTVDRVAAWLAAATEPSAAITTSMTVAEAYTSFKGWLREAGHGHPMTRTAFEKRLGEHGIEARLVTGGRRTGLARVPARARMSLKEAFQASLTVSSSETDDQHPLHMEGEEEEREEYVGEGGMVPPVSMPLTALAVDLETRSAAELHHGRADFIRLVVVGDEVLTPAEGLPVIEQHLAAGGVIASHNGFGFDFIALANALDLDLIELADRHQLIDTMVLSILADPPQVDFGKSGAAGRVMKQHGLDAVVPRLGGPEKLGDLKALAKRHRNDDDPEGFGSIPIDDPEYVAYAKRDGEMQRYLIEQLGEPSAYAWREMSVMARLASSITQVGFRIDTELLDARLAAIAARSTELVDWLVAEHDLPTVNAKGEPLKKPLGSPVGKEALLAAFESLGVSRSLFLETKSGAVSVGGDSLDHVEELLGEVDDLDPAVLDLLDAARSLQKLRSVYGTAKAHLGPDGRTHSSVMPLQASGRLSVRDPGLTVFGKKGGKHVEREIFLPDEGCVILAVDLDQIDARAVAAHAQDAAYLDRFEGDNDVHTQTALDVLGDASLREEAKALSHGINYGMGAPAMVKHAHKTGASTVTMEMAQEFLDKMDADHPDLLAWKTEVREAAGEGVLLDNGFGRAMRADDQRAWTQAPALMGQGAARDLMMQAILDLPVDVALMVRAVVHDEVVFSVPKDRLAEVEAQILDAFTFSWAPPGAERAVPITSGATRPGESWGHVYRKGGE